jgi:recombination protein RecR
MSLEPVRRLIAELSRLPGIGERTAERLAFHLLSAPTEEALKLAEAIRDLKEKLRLCSACCMVTETDPCPLCADPKRDRATVLVVEQTRDVWAIEKSGSYRGLYHVLQGRLSPLDGVRPEDLTLGKLAGRIKAGGVTEVILATNPTAEGDATAFFIQKSVSGVRLTRLARGLPSGSTLEYANRSVLTDAIEGRRELESR